jgi:chemotaxis protein histidine kinase CheA
MLVQNRERLLHLGLTLIGQKVVLEQTDGAIYEGIFHTFTPFTSVPPEDRNKYVLKEVHIQRPAAASNGGSSAVKDGSTLIVSADRVVYLHAKNVDLERPDRAAAANNMNGVGGPKSTSEDAFATDTQISGSRGGKDRELVAAGNVWTSLADNKNPSGTGGGHKPLQTNSRAAALGGSRSNNKGTGSAAPAGKLSGSIGEWDQFKANEELFNVNATFDENLYTTQLDKGSMDANRIAEAERIAREIETSTTDNAHLAEERGQKIENDFRDEEDKYSGVLTEDMKQRHESKTKVENERTKAFAPSEKAAPAVSAGQKKVMNYAAAVAKADPSKKTTPPGFSSPTLAATNPQESKEENTALAKETFTPVVTPDANEKQDGNKLKAEAKKNDEKDQVAEAADAWTKPKTEDALIDKYDSTKSSNDTSTETEEKKEVKKDVAKTSKLNANAKAFTFNPAAKSFTPSFGAGVAQPPQQSVLADPNMAMYGQSMQPHHYMQAPPMGQPGEHFHSLHFSYIRSSLSHIFFVLFTIGMMHMINPQYPGMRYPQPVPQMPLQGQQMQTGGPGAIPATNSNASAAGATAAVTNDDDSTPTQDGDSSQPSAGGQQKPQQPGSDQPGPPTQHQMAMAYAVPPGAYFAGGSMAMPPRVPGYPPQFVAGPQQIPGRPGVYGMFPMQPGGMPPNMPMRGPNGAPYYPGPNAPMPYPPGAFMGHGMMEDGINDPNFRGRGRGPSGGRGRGRGRGGGRGRGRGGYNNNHLPNSGNSSGRNTPQQQQTNPELQQQPGPATNDGNSPPLKQNEAAEFKSEGGGE